MSLFNKLLDKVESGELPGEHEQAQKSHDFLFCFNITKLFDVEEEEIMERIKSAVMLKPPFRTVVGDKPDLYGPFWLASTLVVIIVASSSLITFFSEQPSYNFDQIPVASALIYGICFGCPYIIALMVKVFGGTVSVVEIICVYGYSLAIFIPITCLCFLDSTLIQSILLVVAYSWSVVFLVRGILSMDRRMGDREKMVLGVFIMGIQLLLVLMYKFYFFKLL